jgi:hypothetical protein
MVLVVQVLWHLAEVLEAQTDLLVADQMAGRAELTAVAVAHQMEVMEVMVAVVQSVLFGPEHYVNSHLHTQAICQTLQPMYWWLLAAAVVAD